MFGLSIGITFISYFLNTLSDMNEKVEFLKYISVYALADMRNVMLDVRINPVFIVICVVVSVMMLLLTIYRYDRKELV